MYKRQALNAARAGQEFPMTDGRQAKDWIFIDDVAGGIIALLGAELPPGTTVELGTGCLLYTSRCV